MCTMSGRRCGSTALVGLIMALLLVVQVPPPTHHALAAQGESGNQRPLSDWLDQQGTTSVFFPPVPDLVGWANGDDPPLQPSRFALVDYTGHFNAWIQDNGGPDLGTTVSGTVTEQPLADGRARVHVRLHTTKALTTVWELFSSGGEFPGALLFGHSAAEVAEEGATPALGECDLNVVFINSAPGAALPNLVVALGNLGPPPPGVEVVELRFSARATGALHEAFGVPEGTLGRFMTSQTGLLTGGGQGPTPDPFPVETMFLQALGH